MLPAYPHGSPASWSAREWSNLNEKLASSTPQEVLTWACEQFGDGLAQGTGFGPSGIAIMHMLAALRPDPTVFYLDTDLLFDETYALRDQLADRLGLTFMRVHSGTSLAEQEATEGPDLWARDPHRCCALRKVEPLHAYLSGQRAWVTGLRRDQSEQRASAPIVEWVERSQVVKVNPLATWTRAEVQSYLTEHDLPYNPLLDRGYSSIGCRPCTRPPAAHGDARSGRWAGFAKTECGIHT